MLLGFLKEKKTCQVYLFILTRNDLERPEVWTAGKLLLIIFLYISNNELKLF